MKHTLLTIIFLGSLSAQAQVQFGEIISAGTGCTAQDPLPRVEIENGKGKLTLSSLSITSAIREACNVRLQVNVEKGYQLGIRISDVSGALKQSHGIQTTITASAGLAQRQQEQTLTKAFAAKITTRYRVANQAARDSFSWTDCSGIQTNLALSANVFADKAKTSATVNASIKAVNFDVVVRACE